MALEWLRSNIVSFGGDPNQMIMGGQSAGAGSTHSMEYAYPDDPIIKGQILDSGTVEIIGAQFTDVDSEYERVATTVGCINANRTAELKCMMTIDAERLKHAISNRTFNYFGTPAGGTPMVDNVTMFSIDDYIAMGSSGQFAKLPTLMGTMAQEGDGILNWSPTQGVNRTFSDIVTTSLFDCNIALEATFRATNNVPIWRYHYDAVFPSVTPYPWLRAYHGADIGMVFGTYDFFANDTQTPPEYEVAASTFLHRVYGAFIRDPSNGLAKEFDWPMFNPNGTTLIELFQNNTPTASLTNPSIYDAVCANPPPIPWDELCPSTWSECNPA
jgi:carboxylesterase type B